MHTTPAPNTQTEPAKDQDRSDLPCISSTQLFGAHRQLLINHQGDTYLLRITQQGKLILTK
jgi:hemin uptake protein HemP